MINDPDMAPTGGGALARLRAWPALSIFVAWTVFLWISRLRNVLGNDELSAWSVTWRIAVVIVFVALAFLAASERAIPILIGWTIAFWVLRGGGILLDADYDTGFKAVHTGLMVVSIGLAMWVWATRSR